MSTEPQETSGMTSPGRHLALVVGVNGPPAPGQEPLKYAVLDAQEMAEVLQENYCGFELFPPSPLLDKEAETAQVKNAIIDLAKEAQKGDFVLFFFSGHAQVVSLGDEGYDVYLITHNFDSTRLDFDPANEISLSWLRRMLYEHKKASTVLIILDCCYAGMFGETDSDTYLEDLLQRLAEFFDIPGVRKRSRLRGVRGVLAAAGRTTAQERDGHGLMTGHILKALRGLIDEAANGRGQITIHLLSAYLAAALKADQQRSRLLGSVEDFVLATHPNLHARVQRSESEERLHAIAEQSSLPQNRLKNFVGREKELEEVRRRIEALVPTGGYLTIISEPGQGKSSLIAKLVEAASQEQHGLEGVAHYFIPIDPGPDEQESLLRNLIARLILKHKPHHLPDSFLDSASRAALKDEFHRIVKEIAKQGKPEVIFIDGLDQLVVDQRGERDLSFLPQRPEDLPAGVVFVLGTRPDETLNALRQVQPYDEYKLGEFSRGDFDLMLQHRNVSLRPSRADSLYEKLEKNALYLDLVANELELATRSSSTPAREMAEIVQQIDRDPEKRFSVTINRLRRQPDLWRRVIKPALGLLLTRAEPPTDAQFKQLLKLASPERVDHDDFKQGLEHLGGLVVTNEQQRYTLYHLKFREYLDQTLFSEEEKQDLHRHFIAWCKRDNLALIWENAVGAEQDRHLYARLHYIAHLYHAREWETLFRELDNVDDGSYGRTKLKTSGTRAYALDLDWGREAAASFDPASDKAIQYLPHLWRYTLLRCSLASRADNYPPAAFRLMLLLGQEKQALGLAEMLTSLDNKAQIFALIANHLATLPERKGEVEQLVLRTEQMIDALSIDERKAEMLGKLVDALKLAGYHQEAEQLWQKAKQISRSKASDESRDQMLTELEATLGQTGHLQEASHFTIGEERGSGISSELRGPSRQLVHTQEAESTNYSRSHEERKAEALVKLGTVLRQVGYWQGTEQIWQDVKRMIRSLSNNGRKAEALAELAAALGQMGRQREAEQIWREAIEEIYAIVDEENKVEALAKFEEVLGQAKYWQKFAEIWREVEQIIRSFSDDRLKAGAFATLGITFTRAGGRQEGARIIDSISDKKKKAESLARFSTILGQTGQWREARRVIDTISEEKNKVEALIELGAVLRQEGYWQEAERVIRSISDEQHQSEALTELASMLRQAGRWEEAKRLVTTISVSWHKPGALTELAAALGQAGRWEEAEQLWQEAEKMARSLSNEERKNRAFKKSWDRALAHLGIALAQAQRWPEAEQVIRSISDEEKRAEAIAALGIALAQAGHWQKAELVIVPITNRGSKIRALANLGAVLGQRGYAQEVTRIWQEAEQVISSISDDGVKARALAEFGIALSEVGYGKEAEQILQNTEEMIHSSFDEEKKSEALANLGAALGQVGRWQMARSVIDSINDKWRKVRAFANLGEVLGQAGRTSEAKQIWQEAEKIIHDIASADAEDRDQVLAESGATLEHLEHPDNEWEIEALLERAAALGRMGHREDAEQILRVAERRVRSISDETSRDLLWTKLVGEWGRARRWKEAERAIDKISHEESKAQALANLGVMLGQAGHRQEAERIIRSISDETSRDLSWIKLAEVWRRARRWKEAERAIDKISHEESKAQALANLGVMLGQAGHWQEARRLIDSIDNEWNKVQALTNFGEVLGQMGLRSEAKQICQEVKEIIHSSSVVKKCKAEALARLGAVLEQAEYRQEARDILQEAEQVILSISDETSRDGALASLGAALAQAGRWQEAEQVILSISDETSRDGELINLSAALGQAGRWQEAEQGIFSIVSEMSTVEALADRGATLAEAGRWQEAEQVILSISDETSRDGELINLSAALGQAGRWQEARQVILSIVSGKSKIEALADLGAILGQAGHTQEAEQTWQEAKQVTISIVDEMSRDGALMKLGTALAEAGRWQEAEQVIHSIVDETSRDRALVNLEAALEEAGHWQEARRMILSISDKKTKAETLIKMEATLGQMVHGQNVEQIWQEAQEAVDFITDEEDRRDILTRLEESKGLAFTELRETLEEAEPVIPSISGESLAQTKTEEGDQAGRQQRPERPSRPVSSSRHPTSAASDSADTSPEEDERKPIRDLQQQWLNAASRDEALDCFPLVCSIIPQYPDLGIDLWKSFTWADDFLSSLSS